MDDKTSIIYSMGPDELALLSSIIAIALAKGKTNDEVNILGNLISAIGSILSTIASQREAFDSLKNSKQNSKKKSKS